MTEKHNRCRDFGNLETVFPKAEDGLRKSPAYCLACRDKTACLRTAMRKKNALAAREEFLDRAYASGMVGFFERWSRKKYLKGKMQEKDSKP